MPVSLLSASRDLNIFRASESERVQPCLPPYSTSTTIQDSNPTRLVSEVSLILRNEEEMCARAQCKSKVGSSRRLIDVETKPADCEANECERLDGCVCVCVGVVFV